MNRRVLFRLAAAILIVAAFAHLSTVWPRVLTLASNLPARSWLFLAAFVLCAATALGACALAAFLAWKVPDRPDARALTFFLCFLALYWGSLFRFLQIEASNDELSINLSYSGNWLSLAAIASFLFAAAAFVRFSALFPERLTPDRLPPPSPPRFLRRLREVYLRPVPVWGTPIALLLLHEIGSPLAARIFIDDDTVTAGGVPRAFIVTLLTFAGIHVTASLCALGLGVRNLRDTYRLADAGQRRRLTWVVGGFSTASWMIAGAIGLLLLIIVTDIGIGALAAAVPLALVFAPAVLVTSAAIGVLYSGAIDPALVVRRSTVYGALGVLGLVAFAAIENALSELVEQRLHLPGFVGAMLAGGLVTIALIPLRSAIGSWARRRNPGSADAASNPALEASTRTPDR